jgi:tetratricopeptide (TPR) repeat protein
MTMGRLVGGLCSVLVVVLIGSAGAADPLESYEKGLRWAKEGNYLPAMEMFRQVAKEDPQRPGLHYNMGNVLNALGEYPDAVQSYKEAIRINPGDADAYYNLAMTYSVMDEMDLAFRALEELLKIRPDDGEAHYRLANGYYSRREWEKARLHLARAKKTGYPVHPELERGLQAVEKSPGGKKKGAQP